MRNLPDPIGFLSTSIRQGYATNSSSSHSIITTEANLSTNYAGGEEGEFGWNNFVLADFSSKALYVWTMLFQQLKPPSYGTKIWAPSNPKVKELEDLFYKLQIEILADQVSEILGWRPDATPEEMKNFYIDHESVWSFPVNKEHSYYGIDAEYAKYLFDRITADDVVILGGNDNDDYGPWVPPDAKGLLYDR